MQAGRSLPLSIILELATTQLIIIPQLSVSASLVVGAYGLKLYNHKILVHFKCRDIYSRPWNSSDRSVKFTRKILQMISVRGFHFTNLSNQ